MEETKRKRLLQSFGNGIKPARKLSIADWARTHVKLARSSRSTYADLEQTPWLIQPLESFFTTETSEICLKAPVGSGKTTLLEILACYIVTEKPGPSLFATQTDADAKDWYDTGLLPALEACELVKPLWPKDRHKKGKGAIFFPHMPLWVCGSNLSNFQSKSCDYVILDEAWMLKKSLLEEAKRRTHDRFNSKVLLVSQAGNSLDDFSNEFNKSQIHDFTFQCPCCNSRQPWEWSNLKYDVKKDENDEYVWDSIKAEYQCDCGYSFQDTPAERRSMSNSGRYVPRDSGNPRKGHVAFTYNALAVWWIPWEKLVREWLEAQQAKRKGNINPLRQFLNKRLSQDWTDEQELEAVVIQKGGYSLSERTKWDVTILTVDVQKDEFWFLVRTWTHDGESHLLDYGKALTFSDIEKKQQEWGIPANCVFLDSAYRPNEVKSACAKHGWFGLNGRKEESYPWTDKKTGKTIRKIYSLPNRIQTANGTAIITNFSSSNTKDILHILKQGHGTKWEIADDVSEQYLSSLNSEIKKQTANGFEWIQVKKHNHFFDCEAEQIIAAMLHKCYPVIVMDE